MDVDTNTVQTTLPKDDPRVVEANEDRKSDKSGGLKTEMTKSGETNIHD